MREVREMTLLLRERRRAARAAIAMAERVLRMNDLPLRGEVDVSSAARNVG